MKRLFAKSIAVILALLFVCSSFSVGAVNVNGKNHLDYGSYVLLGDSVASGWSDIVHKDTFFKRVEGSYGAFLADDLGVTYHPYAAIAFRTVELRYIFEDDFEGDEFLFYSVEKDEVDAAIPALRKAVSEAGLITLNVGGNDWGSYVGWHIERAMEEISGTENFVELARPYLENTVNFGVETIETLIEFADFANCLPDFLPILPKALEEGVKNYIANWNIMIEDIYALNPDVTLVVIGMFDNSLQDETMKDVEGTGKLPNIDIEGLDIAQKIVDLANEPMRKGAEKYGYIFVEPTGTLCERQHPSYAGHRHIADMVLEALPDADFPYTDLKIGTKEYAVAQKLYSKGIMKGVSNTEFAPEAAITKAQLADVLYNAAGKPEVNGTLDGTVSAGALWCLEKGIFKADENGGFSSDEEVSYFSLAQKMLAFSHADGFSISGFVKGISFFFKILTQNIIRIGSPARRIDAASYIVNYCGI